MMPETLNIPTLDPKRITQVILVSDELLALENEEDVQFESDVREGDVLFIKLPNDPTSDLLYITKVVYEGTIGFALRVNATDSHFGIITDTAEKALQEGRKLASQPDIISLLDSLRPNIVEFVKHVINQMSDPTSKIGATVEHLTSEQVEEHKKQRQLKNEEYAHQKAECVKILDARRAKLSAKDV